jgi:hypothetical protein
MGSSRWGRRRRGRSLTWPRRGTERGGEGDLVEALTCDRETRRRPESAADGVGDTQSAGSGSTPVTAFQATSGRDKDARRRCNTTL